MSEKTETQILKEKLFLKREHCSNLLSKEEVEKCDEFCEGYKSFMSQVKMEREAVEYAVLEAEKRGFKPFDKKGSYKAGDKVYLNNRGKAVILCVFGTESLENGVRIAAAHVDSPRLDLKPNPLYESDEMALFKTHYYGGIKKYQWTAIPLALHGAVILKDGTKIKVNVGEDENDPQFVITDLLPHLAAEQMKETLATGIKGEGLNILVGSRPLNDEAESELIKLNVMKILNEKYGITEQDFQSAELSAVPAFKPVDIGFDRSLIGAYGHDDRVCAYPEMQAIFDIDTPKYTSLCIFADKEETGSGGNTGMESSFLRYFIADIARLEGLEARDVLSNSECLSADVNAAFDPNYPSVMEKNNSSYINHGACITKYTGARGKSGTSDASGEFMAKVRRILDKHGVIWQTGELGKVDQGGGGTVAVYIANLDVDVVDLGVPVLSMHAPFEVVSKFDVYMTYKACLAFFGDDE